MAVRIRLRRMGRKRQPAYRIVVADSEAPRDGRFVETARALLPASGKGEQIDAGRREGDAQWLAKGATPSRDGGVAAQEGGRPGQAAEPPVEAGQAAADRGRSAPQKPHGVKGELAIFPVTDEPERGLRRGRGWWCWTSRGLATGASW